MWKNFAIAIGFIVAVLCAKTNAISDLKSNSIPAKQITSRLCRSAGLIIIYIVAILSIIISAFSHNLNWKQRIYECGAYATIVCTCHSRAKIARLIYLLVPFISLAATVRSLWVRFVINYSVLVNSLVLTSRLYPSTAFRLWITSYTTNMKMGWWGKLYSGQHWKI